MQISICIKIYNTACEVEFTCITCIVSITTTTPVSWACPTWQPVEDGGTGT